MVSSLKVFPTRSMAPRKCVCVFFFYFILEEAKPIFQCHQTVGSKRKMLSYVRHMQSSSKKMNSQAYPNCALYRDNGTIDFQFSAFTVFQ